MSGHEGQITVRHSELGWSALHDGMRFGGPVTVAVGSDEVLRDEGVRIDDLPTDSMVVGEARAYRRGGCFVVETSGFFPFGGEVRMRRVCRYAANHVRVTLDVDWPAGMEVRRHFSTGDLFLPGEWQRMLVVPPPPWRLSEGGWAPYELRLAPPADDGERMIAHWHRPPLAIVLRRRGGVQVEVGTGVDVWRWQHALGAGAENGSWKVLLSRQGVRLVREPLMTCAGFAPAPRSYRFTWYAAWAGSGWSPPNASGAVPVKFAENGSPQAPGEADAPLLQFRVPEMPVRPEWRRAPAMAEYVRGRRDAAPCWCAPPVQRRFRRFIRQLAARYPRGVLILRGLEPGTCWDPAHVDRSDPDGTPHWDLPDLLAMAEWTRRRLHNWTLRAEAPGPFQKLPSLRYLFAPNGFDADDFSDE